MHDISPVVLMLWRISVCTIYVPGILSIAALQQNQNILMHQLAAHCDEFTTAPGVKSVVCGFTSVAALSFILMYRFESSLSPTYVQQR